MKKFISKLCIILSIVFIFVGLVFPFIIKQYIVIDGLKLNEVTTWLTSSMTACFSLSSIFLVITTLNRDGSYESKSQFQNRFFRLYDIFKSIRDRIGDEYFEKIITELDNELNKIDYEVIASDSLRDIICDTCDCYKKMFEKERRLGDYISCLYNLIKFIDCEDIEKEEKEFCITFLRAGLSETEKKIIFYHSFSNYDRKRFHDIIEKYFLLSGLEQKNFVHGSMIFDLYKKKIYQ